MTYKLLDSFQRLFEGVKYEHRKSHHGDLVASYLYEDLFDLGRSSKLVERIRSSRSLLNASNSTVGRAARRGDGTFGEAIPNAGEIRVEGFMVARGPIAAVEIGTETKILAKAMIKQIDRVMTALGHQVEQFKLSNEKAICVGVVGVNYADSYVSFEGERSYPTDGRKDKHPIQEAAVAEVRLHQRVRGLFDELLILPYKATNIEPFPFEWVNEKKARMEYGAALVRISNEYEARF